ncbi:AI-2E family transporter [Clostridium sp. UBA4548]|uniref:AI-2E family transporter n=1 Tax=Clostridium sp. UBA4548 TaxID=1946361 RepID=UPI0025C2850A|nr:AI-2E family transporter [Clostridium sp. UBA4548]
MLEKYKNIVTVVVLLLVFLLLTKVVNSYVEPILVIFILTYTSVPIYRFMRRNKIFSPSISSVIALLFTNVVFIIILIFIGSFTYNKIFYFLQNQYNGFIEYVVDIWNSLSFTEKISPMILKENILKITSKSLNDIDFLRKGAVYTTDGILTYFIGNIAAYFLLKDAKSVWKVTERIITKGNAEFILQRVREINKIFKVILMVVVLNTIITICGFYILKVDNALILGIVCGILDIIPVIGTIFVFGPLILYNITKGTYVIAGGLLLLYILLIFYAQIIEAKFMSNKLQIHPLPMILAIYFGMKISGFVGVIMAVIYIVTVNEILFTETDNRSA